MNYLSMSNTKLKRDGIAVFGIPAYKAASGFITCPMAKDCIKGCYAKQGAYVWPAVANAYENRLALTKRPEFISTLVGEIKRRKSIKIVRIHDSGDFYSPKYFRDWMEIARQSPNVQFYAYSKMVKMIKGMQGEIPANLIVIFSEGGKQDSLINASEDRHSRVFKAIEDLKAAGYVDTTERDINAIGQDKRIGLVYHGAPSKEWSTAS